MKLSRRSLLKTTAAAAAFTAVGTLIVTYLTKFLTGGLRVEEESEIIGLDNSLHGERAFEIQTP